MGSLQAFAYVKQALRAETNTGFMKNTTPYLGCQEEERFLTPRKIPRLSTKHEWINELELGELEGWLDFISGAGIHSTILMYIYGSQLHNIGSPAPWLGLGPPQSAEIVLSLGTNPLGIYIPPPNHTGATSGDKRFSACTRSIRVGSGNARICAQMEIA